MSFQTGLSGLRASSQNLDVIGNNIANANTAGMKSSRAEFSALVASALGAAGSSGAGIGVQVATVSQQFSQGNINITGNGLDAAINGGGFFQVQVPDGSLAYTRDGSFKLDKDGNIMTNGGAKVLGNKIDALGQPIVGDKPTPLTLPTTAPIPAKTTTAIAAEFNLDARAVVASSVTPNTPLTTYGTSATAYDGQGLPITVSLYLTKTATNTWQVWTNDLTTVPPAAPGVPTQLGGDMVFDPLTGKQDATSSWLSAVPIPMSSANGALTPIPTLDLSKVTQFGKNFSVSNLTQDGYTSGEFVGMSIAENGIITARYSNGETQSAGQIALAEFRNVQGLTPTGGNNWVATYASGDPVQGVPGQGKFGGLRAGALEDSNVDLTGELVNMMVAQRAYQANAQTVKTQDQVLSTLVNLR
jgi:flagellar hook protein FlgE